MAEPRAYDLMVLIDPDIPDERRDAILQEVKRQIDSGKGRLAGGLRLGRTEARIRDRPSHGQAYYHLFQLEAEPELLDQLRHMLAAIDDAVLRHRLIKLEKGVPETPPRPTPSSERRPEGADAAHESEERPRPRAAPAPEAIGRTRARDAAGCTRARDSAGHAGAQTPPAESTAETPPAAPTPETPPAS